MYEYIYTFFFLRSRRADNMAGDATILRRLLLRARESQFIYFKPTAIIRI